MQALQLRVCLQLVSTMACCQQVPTCCTCSSIAVSPNTLLHLKLYLKLHICNSKCPYASSSAQRHLKLPGFFTPAAACCDNSASHGLQYAAIVQTHIGKPVIASCACQHQNYILSYDATICFIHVSQSLSNSGPKKHHAAAGVGNWQIHWETFCQQSMAHLHAWLTSDSRLDPNPLHPISWMLPSRTPARGIEPALSSCFTHPLHLGQPMCSLYLVGPHPHTSLLRSSCHRPQSCLC